MTIYNADFMAFAQVNMFGKSMYELIVKKGIILKPVIPYKYVSVVAMEQIRRMQYNNIDIENLESTLSLLSLKEIYDLIYPEYDKRYNAKFHICKISDSNHEMNSVYSDILSHKSRHLKDSDIHEKSYVPQVIDNHIKASVYNVDYGFPKWIFFFMGVLILLIIRSIKSKNQKYPIKPHMNGNCTNLPSSQSSNKEYLELPCKNGVLIRKKSEDITCGDDISL